MVDLNPYVDRILRHIAPVELAGSDSSEKIPCIVIEQYDNRTAVVLEGEEFLSDICMQIDVYGRTPEERSLIAGEVSETMTAHGFIRTAGKPMGSQRFTMTFRVRVNETNYHFHQ